MMYPKMIEGKEMIDFKSRLEEDSQRDKWRENSIKQPSLKSNLLFEDKEKSTASAASKQKKKL